MKTQNLLLISLTVAGVAWFWFGTPEKDPLTTRADIHRWRDKHGNLYR